MPFGSTLHLNPKPDSFKLHNIGAFIITNTIVGVPDYDFIGIMYPQDPSKGPYISGAQGDHDQEPSIPQVPVPATF